MGAPSYTQAYTSNYLDDLIRELARSVLSGQNPDGTAYSIPLTSGTNPQTFDQLLQAPLGEQDLYRRLLCSLISGQNPDGSAFSLPLSLATGTSGRAYVDTLTADVSGSDPTYMTIKTGVFVAQSASVDIEVQLGVLNLGNAPVAFDFLYGNVTPEAPRSLRTTGLTSPPAAGVTLKHVGRCFANSPAIINRVLHLAGLTPGTRYTWALQAGVVSGAETILPPTGFHDAGRIIAQPDTVTGVPKVYVSYYNDNKVCSYWMGGRQYYNLLDRKALHQLNAQIAVGVQPWALALTPDSTKLAVGNLTGNTLSIIDTASDAVTLTTAALAGIPNDIAPDTGNTVVWVACSDGHLRSINVTTGATVSDYTISANPLSRLVNDGTFAYCVCQLDVKIYKVKLSDGTTTSVTLAKSPRELSLIPGNTQLWVGTAASGGTSSFINVRTSDLAVLQTFDSGVNSTVNTVQVSSSGRLLWSGRQDGVLGYYTINSPDDQLNNLFDTPNMSAPLNHIYLTSDQYIYVARQTTKNDVFLFPSSTWYCRALTAVTSSSAVNQEFCEVTFIGAVKG